ncbi:MAG: glycosyltransferase family 4 protein [Candidatus Hadarchaeia archaeon]
MKVAMISDWYPPKLGGVETLVYEMAKYMNKRQGVEVEVITQDFSSTFSFADNVEVEDGIRVRRLSGITLPFSKVYFHPELPFKIKELFKDEDYDVVHTHHFFTLLSVLATAVADRMYPRRKCIVATNHTYHKRLDSLFFKIPKYISSFSGKSADRIFVGSDAAAKLVEEACDREKIRKVGYGVPLKEFNPKKGSDAIREELGIDSGFLIIYVGRFGKRKGVEYLLKALSMVGGDMGDFKLVIVGGGPMEDKYRSIIRNRSLEDEVKIMGYIDRENLQKFYASSDLAVFPSVRDESFGRVIPEAMASGTPYIATGIPGFDEVHKEGAGRLVPPADAKTLSEAILAIESDKELRDRMSKKARKEAEKYFDWNVIVDRILEVYNELLD